MFSNQLDAWILSENQTHEYYLSSEKLTFAEARNCCLEADGADLASLTPDSNLDIVTLMYVRWRRALHFLANM